MRKFIYRLFFIIGIIAAMFGLSTIKNKEAISSDVNLYANKSNEKLYFTDVISSLSIFDLTIGHYSHSSHQSHQSHRSHYSHVSHYSGY